MNETMPIPHDIPLALPADHNLLVLMLIGSFVLHILFVNLLLGGSILTFLFELKGLRKKGFDDLAHEIAKTVTIHKSMAVVLGVGPLLMMSVLYTSHFYTANALTGTAWISVIPLVSVAFLLLYLHKYSWQRLRDQKGLHLSILGAAILIFLAIPLIFLTNINLMLYPKLWPKVHGFISALLLPNVVPRYLHFLGASLTVSSLFLVAWCRRGRFAFKARFPDLELSATLKIGYTIALTCTAAQFIFGPLVYLTLPAQGISTSMNLILLAGIGTSLPSMYLIWRELQSGTQEVGRHLWWISGLLAITVVCMATGRHLYREGALAPHRAQMAAKTQAYQTQVAAANQVATLGPVAEPSDTDMGRQIFSTYCSGCHRESERLVGPPLTEIRDIYQGKPEGIVAWAIAPGKKRPDYPPMPPMVLKTAELRQVADFILTDVSP